MQAFRPIKNKSKILYRVSLEDEDITATNRYNQFTNGYCTLSAGLCKRVCALIDLPELLSRGSRSSAENLHQSSENNRIYYIERNLFNESPTKHKDATFSFLFLIF